MKRYDAFISYRSDHSVNADLIKHTLVDGGYSKNRIFLDKHNIGPENFDDKIRSSIVRSSVFILVVTKDCFKVNKQVELDWFIEEIKVALDNDIPIIPVLFDNIYTINQEVADGELFLSQADIDKLVRRQFIRYANDYDNAAIEKLKQFMSEYTDRGFRLSGWVKGIAITIAAALVSYLLLFTVGFVVGYIDDDKFDVQHQTLSNIKISEQSRAIEYQGAGYSVIYHLDTDLIENRIVSQDSLQFKVTAHDLFASLSLTTALVGYFDNVKHLKVGGKYSIFAMVGGAIGTIVGYSQGRYFYNQYASYRRKEDVYNFLNNPKSWQPVLEKYRQRESLINK